MSVAINANFFPLRLSLRRKEPVQLKVEVQNRGSNSKMLSLGVIVARSLSLDKGGLKSSASERVEALLPGERKTFLTTCVACSTASATACFPYI